MAEYLFTVKDRETDEILCQGSRQKCADFLGCTEGYIKELAKKQGLPKTNTKYSKYKVERQVFGEIKHGGERKKDVICQDCGVLMVNVGASRKRCCKCVGKYAAEQKRQRMRLLRGNGLVVNPRIKSTDKDGCEGCIYLAGEYTINRCCNYIFIKGMSRPCPPGKDCTVKVERKDKK